MPRRGLEVSPLRESPWGRDVWVHGRYPLLVQKIQELWLEECRAAQKPETTVQEEQEDAVSSRSLESRDDNLKKRGAVLPRRLRLLFRRRYSASADRRKSRYKCGEKFEEEQCSFVTKLCGELFRVLVIRISSFKIKISVHFKALQFFNYYLYDWRSKSTRRECGNVVLVSVNASSLKSVAGATFTRVRSNMSRT